MSRGIGCALAVVGVVVVLVVATLPTIRWFAEELAGLLLVFTEVLLYTALGLGVVAALFIGGMVIWRARQRQGRQEDGAFPIREYKMRDGARLLVDPNHMVGPAGVFHPEHGWMEVNPAAGWAVQQQVRGLVQTTRHLQASTPGDQAIMDKFGSMFRPGRGGGVPNAATAKLLAGAYGPKAPHGETQGGTEPMGQAPGEGRPLLTLRGAFEQSGPERLILGQSEETGATAVFNPVTSVHAGIVGATGTRKTTSMGYTLAAQALKNGYHLICLDPKGGADWRMFESHGEWVDVDAVGFRDAVDGLWMEHDARHRQVTRAGVSTVGELGPGGPVPVVVMVEEYGDLIMQLRARNRREAGQVDDLLDRILRLSRMTGIHLVFIDQYPEHWSPQVMAGTKAKYVFQLGPNQGAKVREYQADRLPDHSVFLHRQVAYRVFDARPKVRAMLAETPRSPLAGQPLLIGRRDGERDPRISTNGHESEGMFGGSFGAEEGQGWPSLAIERGERTNGANGGMEGNGPTAKQEAVWAYLAAHPEAGPTEVSQACGVAKGYAHQLIGEWRGERAGGGDEPYAGTEGANEPDKLGEGTGPVDVVDVTSVEGRAIRDEWLAELARRER